MSNIDRIIVIVLDGVGVGEAPDAAQYGDVNSNSISNTAKAVGGLNLPNLEKLGLGYITEIDGVPPAKSPVGAYGKMQPMSAGKDSISGHWELMGIYLPEPFPTFPHGFPNELIDRFSNKIGRGILANIAASGTEIINEFGEEHVRTGKPIVYTSVDSVFQIAAHEDVVPIEELYRICEVARKMLVEKYGVSRVIARPFVGDKKGNFRRTERRRDFTLLPKQKTILDKLVDADQDVYAVGKIDELFGNRGISYTNHKSKNIDNIFACLDYLKQGFSGLLFVNLVEFDMVFGHRNDPLGYAQALTQFDDYLPQIRAQMRASDIAMIVADHGVDPTTPSTDHSREYVPLLVFGDSVRTGVNLGTRKTLSDVGATIAETFSLEPPEMGQSFLREIIG